MRAWLGVLVLATVLGPACHGKSSDLSLSVPSAIAEKTAWYEIGAYRDASCSAVEPMLGNGLPPGPTARLAYQPKDGTPVFGNIPDGTYAFAAVARSEDCTVLAKGCVNVDATDDIHISLHANDPASGACSEGATCQAGECAPANDNADPSIGANCSLEIVGAGPLTTPSGGVGTALSAPAIQPITLKIDGEQAGFMIAYREVNPAGLGSRVTLLPIDAAGGSRPPLRLNLDSACADSEGTDGIGLVIDGDNGEVTLAKAPCGGTPELQLLNFTSALSLGKFLVTPAPSGQRVSLGASKSAALRGGNGLVVYSEAGSGKIGNLDPAKGIVAPTGSFGGTTDVTDTWMAASDQALAVLAGTGGVVAVDPPPDDDSGAPAPAPAPPSGSPELRLLVVPAATQITEFDAANQTPKAPVKFPGSWGSIAAQGGRVIVLSDGNGPGRSVTYRTFDLGKDDPIETSGFSIEGQDKVTAGDVAIVGDRAYFAVMKPGAVALHVYDHATTRLTPLHDKSFADEPRISGINTVKDGYIAVAATDTRIAVVWTTAKILGQNDPTGFYAVFGCTP